MIDPCSDAQWRDMVRHMRTVCPPPHGTSLEVHRFADLPARGYCAKRGRKFAIDVRDGMSDPLTEETLIHEWAHMLDWRPYHPLSEDHGATWGVWYSRVYRKYHSVS